MKSAVRAMTFLILLFVIISSLGSSTASFIIEETGWKADWVLDVADVVIDAVAVAVPVAIGYVLSRKMRYEREEEAGVAEYAPTYFGINKEGVLFTLPLVIPTVALAFLLSYLTSLALGAMGLATPPLRDASLLSMITVHAVFPALLEELLFRYLPLKLLAPYSRRWCVILSSLFFALIHMSLFQIPYALVAALIFIVADIAVDSVLPSLLMHLVNNILSVLWIKYGSDPTFSLVFVILLSVLSTLSLIPIFVRYKRYASKIKEAFKNGEGIGDWIAPAVFIGFTLVMTVTMMLYM